MLSYRAEMWVRATILLSIPAAFVWFAIAPAHEKPVFVYSTVDEQLQAIQDANARSQRWTAWALRHHEYVTERAVEAQSAISIPPLLDAAPIRERLLQLIGSVPHLDPSDDEDVHIPTWCVDAVASAEAISTSDALAMFERALLVSATEDGLSVLDAIENADTPTEVEDSAQRTCAIELFYALPGDDPDLEVYAGESE